MEIIQKLLDPDNNLTIYTVNGEVTVQDIVQKVKAFYAGEPTKLVLWDFTEANLSKIPSEDIIQIIYNIKKLVHSRKGQKTALVFSSKFGYGLGRMFTAFSEIEKTGIEYGSFHSVEEAKQWLGIRD